MDSIEVLERSVSITPVPNVEAREKILTLEANIKEFNRVHELPEPDCPLTHHFAPGAYGREIFIPADTLVVGKIHKHAHLNMLMQGKVSVATEDGVKSYQAPMVMVSRAGTKRVVYAHTDTIWVTVHLTDSQDLEEIEEQIIAKTFEEFDALHGIDMPALIAHVDAQKEAV